MKNKEQLKSLIDKPITTDKFRVLDKMVSLLGPYMNAFEIDRCVDFMYTIENSKHDVNWSISDAKTQLQIMLGNDRYEQIVQEWKKNNQKILTEFGTLKYKDKSTGKLYDGLDPEDNPLDYEKIYI